MLKYEVNFQGSIFFVSLDSSSGNARSQINYEGADSTELRSLVSRMTGAFGHLIGEYTTPIDLHCAFLNQGELLATLIEGKELVKSYDPEIPEGSVT